MRYSLLEYAIAALLNIDGEEGPILKVISLSLHSEDCSVLHPEWVVYQKKTKRGMPSSDDMSTCIMKSLLLLNLCPYP